METTQGYKITYGDIILISHHDQYLTVDAADATLLSFQSQDPTGKSQKLLVCGKETDGDSFYLTFKYAPGFVRLDGERAINGAPWPDRTYFNLASLKKALAVDSLTFQVTEE